MTTTFGSEFTRSMAVCRYRKDSWEEFSLEPVQPMLIHPAAHVFHYSSTCFEGLKAYRWADGSVHIFRLESHVARMQQSARLLCLPVPPARLLTGIITRLVAAVREEIPPAPGALYIRPFLIGTEPSIGGAATPSNEARLMVLTSPVGDYFEAGPRPLRIALQDRQRSTPDFGVAKTGGNYAAALRHIIDARETLRADQVLFCPDGIVQETGAANFVLLSDGEIMTKTLDGSILPGVTRDSLLTLAPGLGLKVNESDLKVDEVLRRAPHGEAALSGTAAILSAVGTLLYEGREITVGNGETGPLTTRLRAALTDIHYGVTEDTHGWLTAV